MRNRVFKNHKPNILENFYRHAESQGVQLLGDDKEWICKITYGLPEDTIRKLLMPYIATWKKAMLTEEHDHKKQNRGRYCANSELRIKVTGN